jgi:hypothetical protein
MYFQKFDKMKNNFIYAQIVQVRLMSEEEEGIRRMNKHSPKVKLRGSEFRNSSLQEHYPPLSTSTLFFS